MAAFSRLSSFCGAAVLIGAFAFTSFAQEYPNKPIRMIVPYPAGGSTDVHARLISKRIEERLKNPVLVENRPGGNSVVGANFAASLPPDGYALIYFVPSLVSSVFVKNARYDVLKAFAPIGGVYAAPFALAVNAGLPSNSLAEFVAYARANKGKLNYGNITGATTLLAEMFNNLAGIDLVRIEYKGSPPALTALMTNEVQAYFGGASSFLPAIRGGAKIRILAVAGDTRLPVIPEVPTMAELGYPKMRGSLVSAVMAPAGIPPAIVDKLHPIVREAVASKEMEKPLLDIGRPLLVNNDQLMRLIREEIEFYAEAAKFAKYEP